MKSNEGHNTVLIRDDRQNKAVTNGGDTSSLEGSVKDVVMIEGHPILETRKVVSTASVVTDVVARQ